jgi:putative ABC transport system permease protein
MSLWELIGLAWQGISANRMRSGLTVLGIIIGIAAVIALLAIGEGAKAETDKQIQALGSNLVFVRSGAASTGHISMGLGSAPTLTWEDARAIREVCPSISNVCPQMITNAQVQWGGQNILTQITAVTPDYPEVRNFYPERGRFINESDMDHNARVCVIGKTAAGNLFGDEDPIGKQVMVKGELFNIVGEMQPKGQSAFSDMDDQIFVPLTTGYNRLFGLNTVTGHSVQFILAQAKTEEDMLPAEFQITNLLRLRHKIKPPMTDDFVLRTQKDLLQTAQSVTGVFTILLGSTAGISLLVGGIGIMNIMLVSVTERTREIGIRKALGARYHDIMWQFIIEATVLSLTGGIVGIVSGIAGSYAIGHFAGWTTVVTPISVVLAFTVSVIVGLFFGIYPARKAAKLDPIIALRTE